MATTRREFVTLVGSVVVGAAACADTSGGDGWRAAAAWPSDAFARTTVTRHPLVQLATGDIAAVDVVARRVEYRRPDGVVVWAVDGDGDHALRSPVAVAPFGRGLAVADWTSGRVLVLDAAGRFDGVLANGVVLGAPRCMAALDAETVVVTSGTRHAVTVVSPGAARSIVESGDGPSLLNGPRGVAVDADGHIHVVDGGGRRVVVLGIDGAVDAVYGGPDEGMVSPRSVAVRSDGLAVVADAVARTVFAFRHGTLIATWSPDGISAPLSAGFDATGAVWVQLREG